MPYKSEKYRLSETQDRRRKLTEQQKDEIRRIYATGAVSTRNLAEQFNVNKSTIQYIVNPERERKLKERVKNHWRDYYDKDKMTEATKNLRRYKQELYLKGELDESTYQCI